MQWADLRGLRSSTLGVARMNTIATRRQLPLLLLRMPPPLSPLQWRRQPVRSHWVGARPLETGGRPHKNGKKKKEAQSSIYHEMFPEERDNNTPYRRLGGEDSKVRIVTSTHVDKSEVTEWRAAVAAREERRRKYLEKRSAALAAIPDLLVPKEKRKKRKRKPNGKTKDAPEDASEDTPKNTQWGLGKSVIPARRSAPTTEEQAETEEAPKAARRSRSLYNELFKEEAPLKATNAAPVVEDRHVNHGDLQAWIDSLPRDDSAGQADKERSSLLILSNASANLSESDFYRVGPQGQHLDGWGVSISKVMQAYDHNTLQPLGRYFILFASHHAAALYQGEAQRRHNAARRRLKSAASPLAAAPQPGDPDIFTLAAPSKAPLSLHLYKLDKAAEKRLESFSVQGLLSMTPDPPPRACTPVVLSLEGGTLDSRSLSQWIRRDARDRGLGWPVQHLRPYFPPRIQRKGAPEPSEADYHWTEDSAPRIVDPEAMARKTMDETARSALFVLSFPDAHEARRFVRAWHNKELVRSRGESVMVRTHFVW